MQHSAIAKVFGSTGTAGSSSLLMYVVDKYFDHSLRHAHTLAHVGPMVAAAAIAGAAVTWLILQADSGDGDNDTAASTPKYQDRDYGFDAEEDTRA